MVVKFRVSNYFLKNRWIDLIRSVFLLTPILSPLTFASFESSLLSDSLSLRFPRGLDDLCLNLIGSIFGGSRQKCIIISGTTTSCWWCRPFYMEQELLLVVSRRSTRRQKIRQFTSLPRTMTWNLGARLLVSGVICNDPEKPHKLVFLSVACFSVSFQDHQHHAYFVRKIILLKHYFIAKIILSLLSQT